MDTHVRLLAIGDSTKDVFVEIEEASLSCTLNTDACLLCLNYADKIPVHSVTQIRAAGNAANAAVGTRRLGHTAALLTILGDDDDGHELADALRKEKVDPRYVSFDKKRATNYSTILNFKGERTILVYHEERAYVFPKKHPRTDWVYYTSLGKGHEKYERSMLQFLNQHPEIDLLFNPGTHQMRRGLRSLLPVVKRSTILIVNKQEAEHLLMVEEPLPIPNLLRQLHQKGPRTVVITDGPKGSWSFDGHEAWRLDIFPGKVVERTGAGDSYATGIINGLMDEEPLIEAMRHGNANAWSVVQHIGPQKGLLTANEMKKVLKKFAHIKAKKVNHKE